MVCLHFGDADAMCGFGSREGHFEIFSSQSILNNVRYWPLALFKKVFTSLRTFPRSLSFIVPTMPLQRTLANTKLPFKTVSHPPDTRSRSQYPPSHPSTPSTGPAI